MPGEFAAERTTQAPLATAQNMVSDPSTAEFSERNNYNGEPTIERSTKTTPVLARSCSATPSTVRITDTNSNLGSTRKLSKTEEKVNAATNDTINSTRESGLLKFTKETESSNIETGGFAARCTFNGSGSDVWLEFIRYFENLMALNNWSEQKSRRIFLCLLRDQAESFAYGLPLEVQSDWTSLRTHMEEWFGLFAMRDGYIAEAKLRRKKTDENFRDFGQAVESLFRRAYPENLDVVRENALTTFLENCNESADFRMAVKRTKPQTLQEAVKNAIQEECIRLGESEKKNANRPNKPVFDLNEDFKANFEQERRQGSGKPWQRRQQRGGRSYRGRSRSFHGNENISSQEIPRFCSNQTEEKEDKQEAMKENLN